VSHIMGCMNDCGSCGTAPIVDNREIQFFGTSNEYRPVEILESCIRWVSYVDNVLQLIPATYTFSRSINNMQSALDMLMSMRYTNLRFIIIIISSSSSSTTVQIRATYE